MSILSEPYFHDEAKAFEKLGEVVWPDGPTCPRCGGREKIYKIKANPEKKVRHGLYKCGPCKRQFTALIGTIFERSHIPLHKWLQGFFLMASSKKGISANQLHRTLGITLKSAWFMAHRIREAMREDAPEMMGGPGSAVQADETYFGRKKGTERGKGGFRHKNAIISLVSEGRARTFHVARADSKTVTDVLKSNVSLESELHTDESNLYFRVGPQFADHKRVVHVRGQYVGPSGESTNAVENFFSVFKRGMKGTYQHCSERHLQRYINEFDFRFNGRELEDRQRMVFALAGTRGKRLYYRQPS